MYCCLIVLAAEAVIQQYWWWWWWRYDNWPSSCTWRWESDVSLSVSAWWRDT